jgi:hypothetical protein
MTKSKNKSLILRFARHDYSLQASRPSSASRAPRALSRSRSPVRQDPLCPSQAYTPLRTNVVFVDIAGSSRGVRFYSKSRKRDIQRSKPNAQSSSSPASCGQDDGSSGSSRPHLSSNDHSTGSNPCSSFPGTGNPNLGLNEDPSPLPASGCGIPTLRPTGVTSPVGATSSPSLLKGKALSSSHLRAPSDIPTSTPNTQSLTLVHFPEYTSSASCHLKETDIGEHVDLWQFCLIGYVAGKFPGFSSLSKFITNS